MDKFAKIREAVEKVLSCSAHDMDHINRVYNLCMHLAEGEDVDMGVLKAAALLHDIARVKEDNDNTGNTDHAVESSKMAVPILTGLGFPDEMILNIQNCIISHRYRTGIKPESKEAEILFDADKIDTMGALGVARGFIWVGRNNARMYTDIDIEEYIRENLGGERKGRIQDKTKHSIYIEYETKIKHLLDLLHTEKAKEVGKKRLKFFKDFLDRLEKEVNSEL